MEYNLKALARRIAPDSSAAALKLAAGRVEHWASTGLFNAAGVDVGPKALGRGRVRKYPEEALMWCLLWAALADRGLGVVAMATTASKLRLKLLSQSRERKWLEQAMRGEGPALFLIDESIATDKAAFDTRNEVTKWRLSRSPIKLTSDWSGGFFINLTAIYARAVND